MLSCLVRPCELHKLAAQLLQGTVIMDLQAEAQKRKERLAALRATRLGGNTAAAVTGTDQPESGDSSAHAEKKPTLRTVTVEDKASEVAREALEKENVRSKEVVCSLWTAAA